MYSYLDTRLPVFDVFCVVSLFCVVLCLICMIDLAGLNCGLLVAGMCVSVVLLVIGCWSLIQVVARLIARGQYPLV